MPSRNAATATSFAALKTHGAVPPVSPALRASASSGNVSMSGAWNSSVMPDARSSGGIGVAARSGIRQRERDGHAHIRIAEMRERSAVAETYERVHRRARMHDDLDPVVRQVEQEVRLDQLEALVRERRGVDGDLRPHVPRRVRERLPGRHVRQLVAERPRNGPPEAVSTSESTCPQAALRGTGNVRSARCRPESAVLPRVRCAASARSPAATRLSLLARARSTPRSSAQRWPTARQSRRRR